MFTETVPVDVSLAALEQSADREKQLASARRELYAKLSGLKEECQREIRAAIPADKLEAYTRLKERAKLRFTEVTNVQRHTTESLNLTAQMRKQILRETKDALAQLGLNGKIEQIQKKYSDQAQLLMDEASDAREEAPYAEMGPSPASEDLRGFTTIVPPYSGEFGNRVTWGPGSHRAEHWESGATGFVSCSTSRSLNHSGDNDTSNALATSEVHFWFDMPVTGLVEVNVHLQAGLARYGGDLWDEWGFSDANVSQRSRAYLRVITPNPPHPPENNRYATLLDYRRGRKEEGVWHGLIAGEGAVISVSMFSERPRSPGWVQCAVGIEDQNWAWLDTMSSSTFIDSRWFVKQINVRSTGVGG